MAVLFLRKCVDIQTEVQFIEKGKSHLSRRASPFTGIRPRLHEQVKPPLIAQILDPYEATPDEFEQIKHILFALVNAV